MSKRSPPKPVPETEQTHEARQSASRDAQSAQAGKQSDPAWLGASAPRSDRSEPEHGAQAKGSNASAGHHGDRGDHSYAPTIAHGTESGYGPADATPGDHPRFGRQSAYGPHDDYAGTGRDASAASSNTAGDADQASGSRGSRGGSEPRKDADTQPRAGVHNVPGEPQETAGRTVHARSRGPSADDTALRDAVRRALTEARDLDVTNADVTVTSGLVILTGYVPERWMQHVAQTVVAKVAGVTGVDNRLHERRGKTMSRPGESQEGHKI
ncbi:transport-associated protein [Pandoraea iniqua]|uniref:Transport-associated protein n=1 Tax=Pandoraea iniqua TaxID=2508288 RepID=A0A5E4XRB0_9BURK|nr:BON domain-containing protein [Pandoraea iniqua]VVE38866.1 transport-associated protein [Pandoraea iniqua]